MSRHANLRRFWLVVLSGCAAAPHSAEPPIEAHVVLRREAPAAAVENDAQLHPRAVAIEIFALREAPAIDSIELHLTAIAAEREAPFRTVSDLPHGTGWQAPSDAGRELLALPRSGGEPGDGQPPPAGAQRLGTAAAVVAPGLTTRITFTSTQLPALELRSRQAGVELDLDYPETGSTGRLRIVVDDTLPDDAPSLLFVPTAGTSIAGYAVVMALSDSVSEEMLAAAGDAAPANREPQATPNLADRQWRLATHAIGEWNRRTALLAIAHQVGMLRAADVILAADLNRLVLIVGEVELISPLDEDYAWRFQRAVWSALVPGLQRDDLSPALYACLVRQLGSLAVDPTSLRMLLRGAKSLAEFDDSLVLGNLEALDDRDPVPRLRAHDWLQHRGAAVPGYDPLADAAARHAALQRHYAATEEGSGDR